MRLSSTLLFSSLLSIVLATAQIAPPGPIRAFAPSRNSTAMSVNDLQSLLADPKNKEALYQAFEGFLASSQPPAQIDHNCDGSSSCIRTSGEACRKAAAKYVDGRIYKAYTSYTEGHCTAIFTCKDGKYGAGMSGKIIKLAFDRLYSGKIEDGGRRCGGCGSSYMANDCHVTMNFCEKCKSVNTDVAPAA